MHFHPLGSEKKRPLPTARGGFLYSCRMETRLFTSEMCARNKDCVCAKSSCTCIAYGTHREQNCPRSFTTHGRIAHSNACDEIMLWRSSRLLRIRTCTCAATDEQERVVFDSTHTCLCFQKTKDTRRNETSRTHTLKKVDLVAWLSIRADVHGMSLNETQHCIPSKKRG